MNQLCNYTSRLVDDFKVNIKVLLEECLQVNVFEANSFNLLLQRPHVLISSSDNLSATVILHLSANEIVLRGGIYPIAYPKSQDCWEAAIDQMRWEEFDPKYRGTLLDSILNYFSSLRPMKERCEVTVDVHASINFDATITIECPSSSVQHLVGLMHEWYLDKLATHGNSVITWFAIVTYLSPKYWDTVDLHCLNEILCQKYCTYRVDRYYQTELANRRLAATPLILRPGLACKFQSDSY